MKLQSPLRDAITTLAVTILLSPSLPAGDDQDDWPAWRGPSRTAVVEGPAWPDELSEKTLKPGWSRKLGPSYSGPVVVGDLVYTTETDDEKEEVVRAFHRKTGEPAWEARWEGSMKVAFFARSNGSWIRATPAVHDGRIYVAGMRDVLVCLDATSGEEHWKVDFTERDGSPLPAFGFVSSPLVDDSGVYVQAGGGFQKLDPETGKTLWRVLEDGGGMFGSAFSSPFRTKIHGVDQILVQTRTKLCGVTPDEGKILWSQEIPAFRGMNILTPTVEKNQIFTSTYQRGTFLLEIDFAGGNLTSDFLWKNPTQGYMSTPIIHEGHAYLHLRNQRLTCFRLEDGEKTWTSTERFGKYASLVRQGNRILALTEEGELVLFAARPDRLELLGRRQVSEGSTWAHLAVSGSELYVRSLDQLQVFHLENGEAATTETASAPGN